MANFSISTKKILSASNIKRIISLGISLKDSISTLEDKCIEDYDATKTYVKNSLVIYNGYIYKTKTVTTGDFDENKFEKIGDNLDLLTLDDIKALINLSDEEIASLQSLISTEIRLDRCFSSSDAYNRILNAENECKKFTLEQLAKKAGVVYKVVADTTGVDSTEFLYLISNGSNGYNIYAYIDGSAVKISDTNINLDDYAKLSDLNNDFVKKTDADGKYATITTVDGKVDKTSILTSTPSTVTNEQVYSAFVMNTILSGKEGVANYITGPIDVNTVTKNIKGWCGNLTGTTPNGETAGWLENEYMSSNTINQKYISPGRVMYIRSMFDGIWSDWKKVCTTSVADIPTTTITPTFPSSIKIGKMHFIRYSVKNGWANVSVIMHLASAPKLDWFPIANNLPKPDKEINFSTIGESTANIASIAFRLEKLDEGRTLEMMVGAEFTVPNWYNVNFSYPVAES